MGLSTRALLFPRSRLLCLWLQHSSCAFWGLMVLVFTYFTLTWLGSGLLLHTQGGFAIVFSLCPPLGLHHWYSFVSTINIVKQFYIGASLLHTNREKNLTVNTSHSYAVSIFLKHIYYNEGPVHPYIVQFLDFNSWIFNHLVQFHLTHVLYLCVMIFLSVLKHLNN